jgi:hypothetical protein
MFHHFQNKSRHILNNKCKARTICETSKQLSNNDIMYIRNYGIERIHYIHDVLFVESILKSKYDYIVCAYIKYKYLHADFPENHNIKYENGNYFVKDDDTWNMTDKNVLADTVYHDNIIQIKKKISYTKDVLLQYCSAAELQGYENKLNIVSVSEINKIKKAIINIFKYYSCSSAPIMTSKCQQQTSYETSKNKQGYIYLLQEREFIKTGESIYKLGKTKQANMKRILQYPKGSKVILYKSCDDCDDAEKQLLKLFRQQYVSKKDIGTEYFEGEEQSMLQNIEQYFQQATDEEFHEILSYDELLVNV